MMKSKFITVAAACLIAGCMGLAGCSSNGSSGASSNDGSSSNEAQQATQAQNDSDYEVTIDGCEITTDYAGKKAAVVTYTWTNNSDKDNSFMVAISADAFQNGTQLGSAIVSDIDAQATMNKIKPGITQTVQEAYELADDSDITVECSELISFNDELLAEAVFQVA